MSYQFRSAKITSPSTPNFWGGCFVEKDLTVLLEIETDGSILASYLGKSVFDQLLQFVGNTTKRDKDTVKTLLREISGNPFIKTAIIGVLSDSSMYLGCQGKGQAVLVRGEEVGTVISGGFVSQGKIDLNDRIVFHSDRLAKILGNKTLLDIYLSSNLEDFEEELAGILSVNEKAKGLAVLEVVIAKYKILPELNNINNITKFHLQKYLPEQLPLKLEQLKNYYFSKTLRQKLFLAVSSFLFIFFIINTFAGVIRSRNSQKLKQLNQTLSVVSQQFEEAQNLIELNPIRSRELLGSAKLSVSQLLTKTKKNSEGYKKLTGWFEKISASEVAAYKIYKLTAVPVYFDISLIKPGGHIDYVSSYQDRQVVLDRQSKTLYYLDLTTKQSGILAGQDVVKNAATVAIHGTNAYLLNEDGIYRIDIEKKTAGKVLDYDNNWGDIASFQSFAANLYLLDRKNNTIWKYLSTDTGLSDRRSYLQSGIGVNLANMTDMDIDGSIWVTGGAEIIKFTAGGNDQFSFKGLSDSTTNIDSFSTSENEKYIYLLERSLKRILVFDKDGLYYAQYQWEDLKDAQSIVVSEATGKIYVFFDTKIYAIDQR
ncbi:hypothetical protein A3D78_03710 [Candidatus Gottesmanbacteria bacterium RIFCSPHIGHO2_02_FULL_39_14]|uniref:PPM-type phosphatase domain-containing protein n=1 Tax=Candidatus Gottesmanbacteria bacterium RIFCSPHIGHO2_02_FULL_39_14 TaxID=1798383 RepID=A0A1F5ZXD8_9BACT|nr:MAG: hypothetical protein A3D78_03710 [Candidatus Gottesmanbacteria bacterium RIFCSPHIGHO2_02_FULL_39_14]